MCVTCKVPLNIAEGSQPDSQRDRIRELIAEGKTKARSRRRSSPSYGPDVLALPDSERRRDHRLRDPARARGDRRRRARAARAALAPPRGRPGWRAPTARAAADGAAGARELSDDDAARLDADLARYDA